jgi:hypothetical protein
MIIPLDLVTRNKLILVKQLYQRALIQSQITHRVVDRMLAVVGFDLANETLLKAIAVALNTTIKLKHSFPDVIKQVETELGNHNKILSDIIKIQRTHDLRNATQHHGRYPSEVEVSDSRTYTRDFLGKAIYDVWGESFESLSLVDVIQNSIAKKYLTEAETDLINDKLIDVLAKSKASFQIVIGEIANKITENISSWINAIVVTETFKKQEPSCSVFQAFMKTRELIAFQVAGINPQEYLKYKRLSSTVAVHLYQDDGYSCNILGREPTKDESEYVLNFVTNSIVQIESLDADILKSDYNLT